jgi:hypothetical protein
LIACTGSVLSIMFHLGGLLAGECGRHLAQRFLVCQSARRWNPGVDSKVTPEIWGTSNRPRQKKSVGDIRFRQFAKCIIKRDFRVAVSMNFGQLVLTNIGPPSGV